MKASRGALRGGAHAVRLPLFVPFVPLCFVVAAGSRPIADTILFLLVLRPGLEENILTELQHDSGRRSVADCLTCAYLLTDIETSKKGLLVSGSTSVSCLLMPSTDGDPSPTLHTANVGDSRAVMCRGGRAVRLSHDHKASDAAEQARIEEAGGFVLRRRVLGILSVSRSFGDHALKKFVPARPYISVTRLDSLVEFIIVACDGVWDVMSDQDAVDLLRPMIDQSVAMAEWPDLAAALVAEALRRGSTDNVTALIVFL